MFRPSCVFVVVVVVLVVVVVVFVCVVVVVVVVVLVVNKARKNISHQTSALKMSDGVVQDIGNKFGANNDASK